MPNYTTVKESDANYQSVLNDLLHDRMYILLFVTGSQEDRKIIFDRASKMFTTTPNAYVIHLPELTPGLVQYLNNNIANFNQIAGNIHNVAAFSVSMVGNTLVHVITSGEWNATDKLRIFQAYNACINIL